ncbi:MAG: leucyl/phenylalanyl-tRNA--protein transferase [Nocardioides sp.]
MEANENTDLGASKDGADIRSLSDVVAAYCVGYYPVDRDPASKLVWERADPRMYVPLEYFKPSASLLKRARNGRFRTTVDTAFEPVVQGCAIAFRGEVASSWLTPRLVELYIGLHRIGAARSFEVWRDDELVAGEFGIAIGKIFFCDSSFHKVSHAGNICTNTSLAQLKAEGFAAYDVQVPRPYMERFGALTVSGDEFDDLLRDVLSPSGADLKSLSGWSS